MVVSHFMQPQDIFVFIVSFGLGTVGIATFLRFKDKMNLGRAVFDRRWFAEVGSLWPGQAMSLEIDQMVFEGKSDFQDVKIFDSKTYGRVLTLDGVIQATERDEFSYQEMQAHIPMFAHPDPKRVLVVGGGDGGVLREIARHPGVNEIHICELDKLVIDVSKKYMKKMAVGFDDPRVTLHVSDGLLFLKNHENYYDVIIVDSSDPIGPADTLYSEDFYRCMHAALTTNGIALTQAECMWLPSGLQLMETMMSFARKIYDNVNYGFVSIPTYPCGVIGLLCVSKGTSCAKRVSRPIDPVMQKKLGYYNQVIHEAAFVLPAFVENRLA